MKCAILLQRVNQYCFSSYINQPKMCRKLSTLYGIPTVPEKVSVWNRTVLEAEELSGPHRLTQFNMFSLLGEEARVGGIMRKVLASQHPLSNDIKNLFYDDRLNFQVRGLVTLLFAKVAGHTCISEDYLTAKKSGWVSSRQRTLADITEMIHTAFVVHRSILNLTKDSISSPELYQQLNDVNGLSVLAGDYIFAQACVGLGSLQNSQVLDYMSQAISDFVNGIFYGDMDTHGNPLPAISRPGSEWEQKNNLTAGSLMARSCQSVLILGGHNNDLSKRGFAFGKYLGLALQVSNELQPFISGSKMAPFSVASAPVTFHLEQDAKLLEYIWDKGQKDVQNLNFEKIREAVVGGDGINKAKALLEVYLNSAESILSEFESSRASAVLFRLLDSLKEA